MTKTSSPAISIILPAYNAESFIEQSIKSILNQSFEDFEFIIINDGSTDATPNILKRITDKRVRVFHQNNHGITFSLNRGLKLAHGSYIARMDADDIALPDRLQKQIDFLESHPDIGIIGSAVQVIDDSGKNWGVQTFVASDIGIRWVSLTKCPFVHPSVMFRKNLLDEYALDYGKSLYAQDYGLWVRLLGYTKGANIKKPLLLYRVHTTNVSKIHKKVQFQIHYDVSRDQIRRELPNFYIEDSLLNKLLALSLASSKEISLMRRDRTEAILLYLSLWKEFAKKYGSDTQLKTMQSSVIGRAVIWTLFPPLPPDFGQLIHHINQIDPFWLIGFLSVLPGSISGFVRERLVWNKY